jgi:sterol desaturase/sphingolipid hydroxylase (fatty acid hydroxylase superfamily)
VYLEIPVDHETIATNAYYGAFALVCTWELIISRRARVLPVHTRWLGNITLGVINLVVTRGLFPVLGVALAVKMAQQGIGLFNTVNAPAILAVTISLLAMDLMYYSWHWLSHQLPLLWRFHLVHHCDIDMDLTTDLRHHPVEVILSASVFLLTVVVLGAPAFAVFLFGLLQGVSGFWQHGNIRMPAIIDRVIRRVFVTPDMHRIHHSADQPETDSNYTILFSFWDRLFGTYRSEPALGHEGMMLGLAYFREPADQYIDRILLHPFRKPASPAGRVASLCGGPATGGKRSVLTGMKVLS